MIVIVCIDDRKGMTFNGRRQSQDRAVRQRALSAAGTNRLWMNAYSAGQFGDADLGRIVTDEQFLEHAGPGDWCFVENQDLSPYVHKLERLIIYRWNRTYPSDFWFSLDMTRWKLDKTADFSGASHERITEERYSYEQ